ncbi:hypothetical protein ACO1O0_005112 [Amphichorda felina]
MPPRLPMLSALRGSVQSLGMRAFSSTPAVAAPRDEPWPSSASSSSTPASRRSSPSNLLSLHRPSRRTPRDDQKPGDDKSPRADTASRLFNRYKQKSRADNTASLESAHNYLREQKIANDYLREMPRRWEVGDVYAPHDLSPAEMEKFRRKKTRQTDVVDMLGIRPQDMYKNFSMIGEYTNRTGQILPSTKTGLRPVNQRKLSKMIRRAIGMGIYPSVHDHPEVLRSRFFPQSS